MPVNMTTRRAADRPALLFIVIGNFMSKIRPNWFVGVRTPWTLSSKLSWDKTHRLAGWLFMLMGAVVRRGGTRSKRLGRSSPCWSIDAAVRRSGWSSTRTWCTATIRIARRRPAPRRATNKTAADAADIDATAVDLAHGRD